MIYVALGYLPTCRRRNGVDGIQYVIVFKWYPRVSLEILIFTHELIGQVDPDEKRKQLQCVKPKCLLIYVNRVFKRGLKRSALVTSCMVFLYFKSRCLVYLIDNQTQNSNNN